MTQPSDETFLDEMAERPVYWVQADCPPRDGPFSKPVVELDEAERDRLVALARRAHALTWQPMETAPKDGTRIVIARLNSGAVWWVTLGEWSEKWGKFWDRVEPSGFNNPTHWMPLPAPPEARP